MNKYILLVLILFSSCAKSQISDFSGNYFIKKIDLGSFYKKSEKEVKKLKTEILNFDFNETENKSYLYYSYL